MSTILTVGIWRSVMGITFSQWSKCVFQLLYHVCVVISAYWSMSLVNQNITLRSTKYFRNSKFHGKHFKPPSWTIQKKLVRSAALECLHTRQGCSSCLRAARWPDRHSSLIGTTSWIHKVLVTILLAENGGTSPVEGATKMIRRLEHVIIQGEAKKTEFVQP